jgi:hypothetical protein
MPPSKLLTSRASSGRMVRAPGARGRQSVADPVLFQEIQIMTTGILHAKKSGWFSAGESETGLALYRS